MRKQKALLKAHRQTFEEKLDQLHDDAFANGRNGELTPDEEASSKELKAQIERINSLITRAGLGDYESMMKGARIQYMRLSGEVQAYNTQERMDYTDSERRDTPPTKTEKVPRKQQIVKVGDNILSTARNDNAIDTRTTENAFASSGQEGLRGRGFVSGSEGSMGAEQHASDEVLPVTGIPRKVKVAGKTVTFGPDARAIKAAQDYAKEAGIDYRRPDTYAKVDEPRAKRIADAFEKMEHAPNDPIVKKAYKAMVDETMAQWQAIKKTGLKVEFIKPGQPDPYSASPRQAIMDVRDNNRLRRGR
jgi:hypothetical protein